MDSLLEEFVPERSLASGEGNIYLGSIRGDRAILVFPRQSVQEDALLATLALPKENTQSNDVYYSYKASRTMDIHFRVIYPATNEHIRKYWSAKTYVRETYEEYLEFMTAASHISSNWMDNLVLQAGEGVKEEILHHDDEVIVIPDYKWDRRSISSLHLLAVFKDPGLRTIRDVGSPDILVRVRNRVEGILAARFGLSLGDVFMFFHYRPTYFRLHLHVVGIGIASEGLASAIRAVPLHDVIYNLQVDPGYYKKDMFVLSGE